MAATINKAQPIQFYRRIGSEAAIADDRHLLEKAGQTFLQGTPVQLDVAGASGFMIACPTMNSPATARIAGFSLSVGQNLTTSGVAKTLNTGFSPPNQPNAVVIPVGAPPNDGTVDFLIATPPMRWSGVLGTSGNDTGLASTQAMLGTLMGLTKDAGNNFWYLDNNITTAAGGACVEVVGFVDPPGTVNGRLEFIVTNAAQQLSA